ncbi:hypothetical protein KAU15_00020, partial [candidate division WOR-3 bacterium]|nr:hypothetical protein [candidate division WOR-3 bacterium]
MKILQNLARIKIGGIQKTISATIIFLILGFVIIYTVFFYFQSQNILTGLFKSNGKALASLGALNCSEGMALQNEVLLS